MKDNINAIPLTVTNKNKKNFLNPINFNSKKGLNNNNENNSFQNYYKLNDESFNQQYESLINLWKDLGVTIEFQEEFKKMFSLLIEEEKEICIHNEKKTLKKVRNSIKKLIKEISSREKNIQLLIKLNEIIENDEENIDDDSVIIDSVNLLKKIRINSLYCVNNLIKIREITLFQKQNGKYNTKNMNSSYKYNENYLMKMKYDMNFLKNSKLSKYIEFSNGDIDPFLICCSKKINKKKNQDKILIPIPEDLLDEIKQAKYYITQDFLFSNISQDNKELNNNLNIINFHYENNNIETNSKINNRSIFLSKLNKENILKTRISNSFNNSFLNNTFSKKINMSRTLHKLKIKKGSEKYDLMFLNPKQEFYNEKNSDSSRINSYSNKFDNSNLNNINITKLYNNKNDKLINSEIFEESDEGETETNIKKNNWKNEMMTRDVFLQKLNEYEYKNEDKDENSLSIILKEKIKNIENKETIKNKENSDVKKDEKKTTEKDYNDDSEELDYEFLTDNENENENENKDDSEDNDSNEYENKLLESSIKNYHIEYFENDISDLIEIITKKNYINSIPKNLKDLFNLNKNSFSPIKLMKGIYPKIIVSYIQNEITGLCIYSFSSLEKPIKILINHLSSINYSSEINDYTNQIEGMINFIKETIKCDIIEIKINSKKNLDKNLKSLFKTILSFKVLDNKLIYIYYDFDENDEKENKINKFLSIKSSSLISYSSNKYGSSKNVDKYINLFQIYSILNEKKESKEFKLEEIGKKGLIFETDKLKEYFKKSLTFSLNNLNIEQLKSFIHKNINENIDFKDMKCNEENENDLITFNFIPLLRSGISVQINEYLYNRIEDNIELFYDDSKECKIYLIPTYNKNVKVIIGEMNDEMNNKLINNTNNIYEIFYDFYNKLNKDNNKKIKKVIFIPSFSIQSHLIASNINNVEKNILLFNNFDNTNLYIISVDEYYQIEWNIDKNYKNSLYNEPKIDKDIVIKDSFLFGIFHQKLYDSNKISAIQLYIINKDNWNKKI